MLPLLLPGAAYHSYLLFAVLQVTERLREGKLTGAMLWQVCYEGYPGDKYQIDPSNYEDYKDALNSMCKAVQLPPATT